MSLKLKTILGIISIEISLLGIIVVTTLNFIETTSESFSQTSQHLTSRFLSSTITDAIISEDLAAIDAIANEILSDPGVVGLTVRSSNGNKIFEDVAPQEQRTPMNHLVEKTIDIKEADNLFGTVQITFTNKQLNENLDRARNLMFLVAALEVLLSAVFSYGLWYFLNRRFTNLRKAADDISEGRLQTQIATRHSDELSHVEAAFNKMTVKILDATTNMEEQIKKRTEDLSIEKEKALKASRSKSDFISSISHDIRTPLHGLLGLTEDLMEDSLSESQQQKLMQIQECGEGLLSILSGIIDLSQIEGSQHQLKNEICDIDQTLQSVCRLFKNEIDRKGLDVSIQWQTSSVNILSDRAKFKQIMVNLLGNAIKFTDRGMVKIDVQQNVQPNSDMGDLEVKVVDTGLGISEKHLSEIFQSFSQGDHKRFMKHGGSGLGLTIASKLATLMGGDISVDSKLGEGSCFTLHLPIRVSRESGDSKSNTKLLDAEIKAHPRKVLVVEDNEINRTMLVAMLQNLGQLVDSAENGAIGLEKALADDYDMILMDCHMPVMNGFEATKEIRRELKGTVTIVAVTAGIHESDRKRCIQAGMNDFYQKPFRKKDLIQLLSNNEPVKKLAS